jgi:hypothetical protein
MKWDYQREVWIDRDDYAYDASRFGVGTRSESQLRSTHEPWHKAKQEVKGA